MLVILIINFRLKARNLRIDILDVIVLHTLRWSKSFKAQNRRIVVYSILLYCFFSHNYYSSEIKSDLVLTKTAQFLRSLHEIVASNRTPSMFGTYSLYEEFTRSNNENVQMLLKRAVEREKLYSPADVVSLANGIINEKEVGLFQTSSIAH